MSKHRVVFLGTPAFAAHQLRVLNDCPRVEVLAIVTQPDRPSGRGQKLQESEVAALAKSFGISVLKPDKIGTASFREEIQALGADVGVVVAYGKIIGQKLMDLFEFGIVNLHGSLLPRWRGAAPIQRALMAGDSVTGVSLQRIVRELDAGPVIGERRLELNGNEVAETVYEKLMDLGGELFLNEFLDYLDGKIIPKEQDSNLVTYAEKIEKQEGLVNWELEAHEIYNTYRGLHIWPGVWTLKDGKRLKMTEIKMGDREGASGEILQVLEESIVVGCKSGSLEILEVQPESKGKIKIKDYLRGNKIGIGEKFDENH